MTCRTLHLFGFFHYLFSNIALVSCDVKQTWFRHQMGGWSCAWSPSRAGTGPCSLPAVVHPAGCALSEAGKISPTVWRRWIFLSCFCPRGQLSYLGLAWTTRPGSQDDGKKISEWNQAEITENTRKLFCLYLEHKILLIRFSRVGKWDVFKFNATL